jgi:hypothetical protein
MTELSPILLPERGKAELMLAAEAVHHMRHELLCKLQLERQLWSTNATNIVSSPRL